MSHTTFHFLFDWINQLLLHWKKTRILKNIKYVLGRQLKFHMTIQKPQYHIIYFDSEFLFKVYQKTSFSSHFVGAIWIEEVCQKRHNLYQELSISNNLSTRWWTRLVKRGTIYALIYAIMRIPHSTTHLFWLCKRYNNKLMINSVDIF